MSTYRRSATALGILAAAVLFWMENPWFNPETISPDLRTAATVAFWAMIQYRKVFANGVRDFFTLGWIERRLKKPPR